jgi:hypothetical protein
LGITWDACAGQIQIGECGTRFDMVLRDCRVEPTGCVVRILRNTPAAQHRGAEQKFSVGVAVRRALHEPRDAALDVARHAWPAANQQSAGIGCAMRVAMSSGTHKLGVRGGQIDRTAFTVVVHQTERIGCGAVAVVRGEREPAPGCGIVLRHAQAVAVKRADDALRGCGTVHRGLLQNGQTDVVGPHREAEQHHLSVDNARIRITGGGICTTHCE